ncbi:RNA-binding motif protein, X-linked 2 [Choristoneura fumiferana]|uniref:RNA-binding motif protein, X-linked 2 n=1 Tax=Choristoneura fumiferana TaxID=7141 RepID=UPI003D15C907
MNPMTNVKNVLKLSKNELTGNSKSSWHDQYKDSAWVFVGGLPYDLTEGDIICVFSQYGEVVNINLVRDKATGKSRGFAFICYEDQRSTILAVDNLNGIKILGRTVRVDHCEQYRAPNADMSKVDELTAAIRQEGCAPVIPAEPVIKQEPRKENKEKVKKSKKKKKKRSRSSDSSD